MDINAVHQECFLPLGDVARLDYLGPCVTLSRICRCLHADQRETGKIGHPVETLQSLAMRAVIVVAEVG